MIYSSIRSVLPYINENLIDTETALEYAYQAYDLLGVKPLYDQRSCVLTVDNFKTNLPSDFYRMQALVYIPSVEVNTENTYDGDTAPQTDPEYDYNHDHITRIQSQGIINNYNLYTLPIIAKDYSAQGILLRYINGPFSKNYHCTDCPNITSGCEYTYTITPGGEIITNIEKGIICIAYLAYAKDAEDDLLIPDDAELRQAIASYIHMKALEMKTLNMEPNAYQLYGDFRNSWERLAMKVKASLKIKDLDHVMISDIQERYVEAMRSFVRRIR